MSSFSLISIFFKGVFSLFIFKEPSIILFSKSFEMILIIILLFSAIIKDSPRFKFFISICSF